MPDHAAPFVVVSIAMNSLQHSPEHTAEAIVWNLKFMEAGMFDIFNNHSIKTDPATNLLEHVKYSEIVNPSYFHNDTTSMAGLAVRKTNL